MNTTEMLVSLGYLILFMYLSLNFLMLALEKKINIETNKNLFILFRCFQFFWRAGIEGYQLMNPIHNPDSYIAARIYGLGTLAMLFFPCF